MSEQLYNKLKTQIDELIEFLKEYKIKYNIDIKRYNKEDGFLACMENYALMTSMITIFNTALNLVNDINTAELSDQRKSDLSNQVRKISSKMISIRTELNDSIQEIGDKIFKEITSDPYNGITRIRKVFHDNLHSVHLYSYVVQKMIDHLYTVNRQMMFKIMNFIEEDKDIMIGEQVNSEFKHNKILLKNPPLRRFGLLPVTDSMELSELLPIILKNEGHANKKINKIKELESLANKLKIGFIVLYHVVNNPVEYTIREIDKNAQNKIFGVNSKTIDRFKTIIEHGPAKYKFDEEIINESADKFYVIESIDGKTFRCLTPFFKTVDYGLSKFRVENIINYINNKLPSRAANYHAMELSSAVKNMFLSRPFVARTLQEKTREFDISIVRSNITNKIVKHCNKLVDKCKSLSSQVILDILHDKEILEIFEEEIVENYQNGIPDEETRDLSGGIFPFSEILNGFITNLANIINRFSREIHDGYMRNPLETFDEDIVKKKIAGVISDAIMLVLGNEATIYTNIFLKYLVLN